MTELIHVMPQNDLREHTCSVDCWCHPTPDADNDQVMVHHSLDQRESYEQGRLPS